MNKVLASLLVLIGGVAQAQTPTPMPNAGVAESTDPSKAAAVEQAASAVRAQRAQDARMGRPQPAVGLVRAKTDNGVAYLSGGVTTGDRLTMHAERAKYSLWVATVAKGSGAYLADAKLRIVHLDDKAVVLDRTMDGPWFFIALPAGRYEVAATLQPDGADKLQTLTTRVTIPKSGQRQAVLRFDSTAQVSPDMVSVFKGNPFGAAAPVK